MDNVRKLRLAEDVEPSENILMKRFSEKTEEVSDFLKENKNCGFALVAYSRAERGTLTTFATYFLHDPIDGYALPDLVKERIINIRDESKEIVK